MGRSLKGKSVVIRVDASAEIGSGHLMRCLTLADELRRAGADVVFVSRLHDGNLVEMVIRRSFPVIGLRRPGEFPGLLGVSQEEDAEETIAELAGRSVDLVLVDHYSIDEAWENRLSATGAKIAVIDDLADRRHRCGLLVDQNLHEHALERYGRQVPAGCVLLLGPTYALLREEFGVQRRLASPKKDGLRKALVFYGGMDATGESEVALAGLAAFDSKLSVDLVVGPGNRRKDSLRELCALNPEIRFHCDIDYMAKLMADADLCLGAAGTTTWERCALGLPALVTIVAPNQVESAGEGERAGVQIVLGRSGDVDAVKIAAALKELRECPEALGEMSRRAWDSVDGKGAERVVMALGQLCE